ncbi:TetR/AcrR family transcriptional regulator [Actinopolymorpha alba]|uniref:TetR/AcrR family transcriptional regulator n=1 Tax=Actinopolymorpha alba TaxID=533267 RepID=UPI00035CBB6C|nr:TetR/AcrR family transcriptional regulator [Actinopolymorpha alba]
MARTVDVAAHERRRNEFLDAAQRLIESRGYEQMSVQDVLSETGASRGAFYHYFGSKHDLLSAVVDRFSDTIAALLDPITSDSALSPMEQLRLVFAELSAPGSLEREELAATLGVWYSDGNVLVRQQFRRAIIDRLARLLTRVIARGARNGVFAVPDPDRAGLILATLLQDLNDALADELFVPRSHPVDPHAVERIVDAHTWAVERILGLPDGSTALIDATTLLSVADPDPGRS